MTRVTSQGEQSCNSNYHRAYTVKLGKMTVWKNFHHPWPCCWTRLIVLIRPLRPHCSRTLRCHPRYSGVPRMPNLRKISSDIESDFKKWIFQHDVQFSCAINQPLLAHHWRVHQCLLTSRFITPLIPWGVSAPGGKMLKQLLKHHNFLNNSPIFIIESSTFDIFAFQKALHTIHFNLKSCFGFGERYLTP